MEILALFLGIIFLVIGDGSFDWMTSLARNKLSRRKIKALQREMLFWQVGDRIDLFDSNTDSDGYPIILDSACDRTLTAIDSVGGDVQDLKKYHSVYNHTLKERQEKQEQNDLKERTAHRRQVLRELWEMNKEQGK